MKKSSLLVIILAVIILAAGFLIFKNKLGLVNGQNANQSTIAAPKENSLKFTGQGKIEIPATVPAGDSLTVTKVMTPGNSFVVIKDSAGKIVGASNVVIFPQIKNLKIIVPLESGKSYTAELHGDNGNGIFDPAADPPIIIGGKTVTASFKVK